VRDREVVTYPVDVTYIRVQYYVYHLSMYVYVRAYVCIESKISLRTSQKYTSARQLYEKWKSSRTFLQLQGKCFQKNNGTNYIQ